MKIIDSLDIVMGYGEFKDSSITYGEYFKSLWQNNNISFSEGRADIVRGLLITMSDKVLLEIMKGAWNIFAIQSNIELPFPSEPTKELVKKEYKDEKETRPGVTFGKRKRNLENRFYQDVFGDVSKGVVDGSFLTLLYIELKKRKLGNDVSLPYKFCFTILNQDIFTKLCSESNLFSLLTEVIIKDEDNTKLVKEIGLSFINQVKKDNLLSNGRDESIKSFIIDFKEAWNYSNKKKDEDFIIFLKEYIFFYSNFVNINLKENDHLKKGFDLNVITWRRKKDCFNNRYSFFEEEKSVAYEENEVRKVSVSSVSLINYQRDKYANFLKESTLIDNLGEIFYEFNKNKLLNVEIIKSQEENIGILFEKGKGLINVSFIELTDNILKLVLNSNLSSNVKGTVVIQELNDLMEKVLMKEDLKMESRVNKKTLKF